MVREAIITMPNSDIFKMHVYSHYNILAICSKWEESFRTIYIAWQMVARWVSDSSTDAWGEGGSDRRDGLDDLQTLFRVWVLWYHDGTGCFQ